MAKKHDENRDLRSLARIAKINPGDKTIQCAKSANIGIHAWGKIDFLTKYCGWHFIWDNAVGTIFSQFNTSGVKSAREQKKAKKEPKLSDKTKKVSKQK